MKPGSLFTFLVCTVFLLFSCDLTSNVEFEITSPRNGWTYYDDSPVNFSTNIESPYLKWNSSIDGFLGTESQFSTTLTEGNHVITLERKNDTKSVNITVKHRDDNKTYLINENSQTLSVNPEKNHSIYSLSGSASSLCIQESESSDSNNLNYSQKNLIKDFVFSNKCSLNKPVLPECSRNISDEEENKTFFVMNTKTQTDAYTENVFKYYQNEKIDIYISDSVKENDDFEVIEQRIDICINQLKQTILPRLEALWGDWIDVNGDGRIAVLFTPTINNDEVSIGFFYQNDYFQRITDTESENYNPFSNERDIIYVAVPDMETGSYSVSSILATLGHEITHAINFSNKTFSKLLANADSDAETMETFLDEGLSHVTENLLGYGISGGNIGFINRYLANSVSYSFCKADAYGRSDSAGQRGAMALFLYYLFCKAGGMSFNEDSSYTDNGGISFLKGIIESPEYGWNAIGYYFNKKTDVLFYEFCKSLTENNLKDIFNFDLIDPVTGERQFYCDEFSGTDYSVQNDVLEYSFIKLLPFSASQIIIKNETVEGNVFFNES